MKKLVFVIVVLIGIMSSQLIYADESCGTASGIYHGTSYAITCKSGRQIKCSQVLSDQGMGWECDCDEHGCKGHWDSEIDQASKISCCSVENQIPVAGGSNIKSEEPVKLPKKLTTAKLRTLTSLTNKGGEALALKVFFEMKNKYSIAFDAMIVKQVVQGVAKGPDISTAVSLTMLCTLLDLRFNDEMSCATTMEEVKTIKDYKVVVNLYHDTLLNYIKSVQPYESSGMTQAQFERMKDDFFNRSIPLLKKLYLASPEREHCR